MFYTIVAYRWGWLNAHHYPVAATPDATRACELAELACDDRGGKYGVVVYEWASEIEYKQYAYFPSVYREEAPFDNQRIDMFEGIGHDLHAAVTDGLLWGAPEEPFGSNVPRAFEAPDWAVEFVQEREQTYRFINACTQSSKLRRSAGLPPRTKEENTVWMDEQSACIAIELNQLLAKAKDTQVACLARYAKRKAEEIAGVSEEAPPAVGSGSST